MAKMKPKKKGKKSVDLPSEEIIRSWVRETIQFYSGYPAEDMEDDQELLKRPIEIDPASLVDLAGTLRHGVKYYNPNETVLVSDVDDETVGGITATVTTRIRGT